MCLGITLLLHSSLKTIKWNGFLRQLAGTIKKKKEKSRGYVKIDIQIYYVLPGSYTRVTDPFVVQKKIFKVYSSLCFLYDNSVWISDVILITVIILQYQTSTNLNNVHKCCSFRKFYTYIFQSRLPLLCHWNPSAIYIHLQEKKS